MVERYYGNKVRTLKTRNTEKNQPSVAAAVPLHHYQVDPVHQPLGIRLLALIVALCEKAIGLKI